MATTTNQQSITHGFIKIQKPREEVEGGGVDVEDMVGE